MNHSNEKLVRERGPVRVAWVCLGEGYNGDYDPRNSEDEMRTPPGKCMLTAGRCACVPAELCTHSA